MTVTINKALTMKDTTGEAIIISIKSKTENTKNSDRRGKVIMDTMDITNLTLSMKYLRILSVFFLLV